MKSRTVIVMLILGLFGMGIFDTGSVVAQDERGMHAKIDPRHPKDKREISPLQLGESETIIPLISIQLSPDDFRSQLSLEPFEALASNDLSVCSDSESCRENVDIWRSWACMVEACNAADTRTDPLNCWTDVTFIGDRAEAERKICAVVEAPTHGSVTEFLKYMANPDMYLEDVIELNAFYLAIKGSGDACVNYIKNHVGPYGENWTFQWYWRLAGCRIISGERSRKAVEKNFSVWYHEHNCGNLTDFEFINACVASKGILDIDR